MIDAPNSQQEDLADPQIPPSLRDRLPDSNKIMQKVMDKVHLMEEAQLILQQSCTPPSIPWLDEDDIGVNRYKKKGPRQKIDESDNE